MIYFPKLHINKSKMKVELDFSTYATESNFKNTMVIHTLQFTKKVI